MLFDRLMASLVVLVVALAAPVMAQDADTAAADPLEDAAMDMSLRPTVFDEMVIVATRTPIAAFDAPYSTDVVDARQLKRRQYRTTPRALRDLPGVMAQETATGQGSPFIRGFTSQRTVLMVDGIRLNNSVFREGPNQYWATVDAFSVDRFELVRGPASVLYGSDAIGGTVNALTVTPYAYGQQDHWAGRVLYRYHSGENSHIGRGEFSAAAMDDRLGFIGGGTIKDFGDVEGGDDVGEQPNTGYDEYDADLKVEYWINPTTRLVFAHQRVRINDAPRTHRTFDAVFWEGTGPPGTGGSSGEPRFREQFDQERELTYVQLHAEDIGQFIDAMHLSVSHQHQGEVRDRIRQGADPGDPPRRDLVGFDVDTLGLWASFESPSRFGRWTYGVDYYHDWVDSFSSTNPIQGAVGDDATYHLLGIYVQNAYDWTDRLTSIIGGRFTYARADADSVDDGSGNTVSVEADSTAFVGSARLTYKLIPEQLNVYGGVSQGFRAPNLMDLTSDLTFGSGGTEIGSPDLDPERYITYEVGLKARDEDWQAQVSYFYTVIDDQIVRVPSTSDPDEDVFQKVNATEGYVNGIEAAAAWRFTPQLTLFGNLTWQEGQIERPAFLGGPTIEEYFSRFAPLSGSVGLRYEPTDAPVWIEGIVRMADRQDKLSAANRDDNRIPPDGTPGYIVPSIYAGYDLTDDLTLRTGLENLTDEDYRIHGSGQNMPGRSWVVSIEARF